MDLTQLTLKELDKQLAIAPNGALFNLLLEEYMRRTYVNKPEVKDDAPVYTIKPYFDPA
jgi:hypothetical protein